MGARARIERWTLAAAGTVLAFGLAVPAAASTAPARGCRRPQADRPYVCDVGEPRPLSRQSFERIFEVDNAVRAAVARIGMPDYAELQKIDVNDPWVGWELRLYYRDYDKMLIFGRAMIIGNPRVSLLRHEGPIPPEKLAFLSRRLPSALERAEEAARRAEEAADRAADVAERAERLADDSERAAAEADRSFRRAILKN